MIKQLKSYLSCVLESGLLDEPTISAMETMYKRENEALCLAKYFDNKELIYVVTYDDNMFPYMEIDKNIDSIILYDSKYIDGTRFTYRLEYNNLGHIFRNVVPTIEIYVYYLISSGPKSAII